MSQRFEIVNIASFGGREKWELAPVKPEGIFQRSNKATITSVSEKVFNFTFKLINFFLKLR